VNVEATELLEELLNQNSQLRLELATLSALKKKMDGLEKRMEQSQQIPPEAMEMLSKLDIR
jgi:hypothetical protein